MVSGVGVKLGARDRCQRHQNAASSAPVVDTDVHPNTGQANAMRFAGAAAPLGPRNPRNPDGRIHVLARLVGAIPSRIERCTLAGEFRNIGSSDDVRGEGELASRLLSKSPWHLMRLARANLRIRDALRS